jgi:anti-anti-sigma factor
MSLERMEACPQLQIRDDVLAVGFAGGGISGDDALALAEEQLLPYVAATRRGSPPRFVVLDLRNVATLSSLAIGKMLGMRKKGNEAGWTLVVVTADPAVLDLLAFTRLDKVFPVVREEGELRRLVDTVPPPDGISPRELPPEILDWARRQFSDEEILAGLQELRNGGGQELADFIAELEQEAAPRE